MNIKGENILAPSDTENKASSLVIQCHENSQALVKDRL